MTNSRKNSLEKPALDAGEGVVVPSDALPLEQTENEKNIAALNINYISVPPVQTGVNGQNFIPINVTDTDAANYMPPQPPPAANSGAIIQPSEISSESLRQSWLSSQGTSGYTDGILVFFNKITSVLFSPIKNE